ncbi:hypothetical protein JAAARDRAFT_175825 [Jaapia argillacea MUCL 33604]|uniref:BTB domain-containing protein n=1 Tax=Jaapia argillacea MUCL 33604 TaxID=933084 RepID=A0A067PWA3_9AGAM|nr:hypothetical protein JAAARDRAFT_175825 [Jaapia argillacea MUCL 33604]
MGGGSPSFEHRPQSSAVSGPPSLALSYSPQIPDSYGRYATPPPISVYNQTSRLPAQSPAFSIRSVTDSSVSGHTHLSYSGQSRFDPPAWASIPGRVPYDLPDAPTPMIPSSMARRPHTPPPDATERVQTPLMSEPAPEPEVSTIKHPRYFFPDGSVVFLVEETLFRVHWYILSQHSSYFEDSYPVTPGLESSSMPFSSALSPIILEDVTVVDFERFLSAVYPSELDKTDASTVEEWTSILHLSTQFSFASIRRLAIRSIFPIASPIDKIVLANKYEIEGPEWKRDAYVDVCQRQEALTLEEGERLGMAEVVKIVRVRQEKASLPEAMRGKMVKWVEAQFGFGLEEEEEPETKFQEDECLAATPSPEDCAPKETALKDVDLANFRVDEIEEQEPVSPPRADPVDGVRRSWMADPSPSTRPSPFTRTKPTSSDTSKVNPNWGAWLAATKCKLPVDNP